MLKQWWQRVALLFGLVAFVAAPLGVVGPTVEPAGATVCEPALNSCWDEAFYLAWTQSVANSVVPLAEASIPIVLELADFAVTYCDTYPTCDEAIALAVAIVESTVASVTPETVLQLATALLNLATSLAGDAPALATGTVNALANSVGPLTTLALSLANTVVGIVQNAGPISDGMLEFAGFALDVAVAAANLTRAIAEPLAGTIVNNLTTYVQNHANNPVGLAEDSLQTAFGLVALANSIAAGATGDAAATLAPTVAALQGQLNAVLALVPAAPADPATAVGQLQAQVQGLVPGVDEVAAIAGGIPTAVAAEVARLAQALQGCTSTPGIACTGNNVTVTPGTCYQIQADATYQACVPEGVDDVSTVDPGTVVLGLIAGGTSPASDPGGSFINPYIWQWNHSYDYEQCRVTGFPPTVNCKYVGVVRLKATLELNGFEATMMTEATVLDGPAIKSDLMMECREDDYRDSSCGGPWEDGFPGYTRERFFTVHKAFKKKTDKFFWNFSFAWEAFGWSGNWSTPNFTTARYVCNGAWTKSTPGAPCYFLDAPGAPKVDIPYQRIYLPAT